MFADNSTFKNILFKISPNNTSSYIYKIPFSECDQFYIEHTSKTPPNYARSSNESSAIYNHVREFNRLIKGNQSGIFYNFKDFYSWNIIESIFFKNSY